MSELDANNEKMAIFMGRIINPYRRDESSASEFVTYDEKEMYGDWRPHRYNSSWDWLLPVWQKITHEIGLWMMTHGHDKLWLEASHKIETAICREFDCRRAHTLMIHLMKWHEEQIKN